MENPFFLRLLFHLLLWSLFQIDSQFKYLRWMQLPLLQSIIWWEEWPMEITYPSTKCDLSLMRPVCYFMRGYSRDRFQVIKIPLVRDTLLLVLNLLEEEYNTKGWVHLFFAANFHAQSKDWSRTLSETPLHHLHRRNRQHKMIWEHWKLGGNPIYRR